MSYPAVKITLQSPFTLYELENFITKARNNGLNFSGTVGIVNIYPIGSAPTSISRNDPCPTTELVVRDDE